MKVAIKSFDVQMEVKNRGIELEVRDARGRQQLGDLVITKTQTYLVPWPNNPHQRDRSYMGGFCSLDGVTLVKLTHYQQGTSNNSLIFVS